MIQDSAALGVTVLGSGSRGNAIIVHGPEGGILIDAGFSALDLRRRLTAAGLDETMLRAILVSHEHDDHVKGVRVLARQLAIPVYTNRRTADVLRSRDAAPDQLHLFGAGIAFTIDGFAIEPFTIPHDASDPVAFTIRWGGRKIGIATDLGHASHLVCHHLQECDLLVLESNHDLGLLQGSRRPWSLKQRIMGRHGHLSNEASMDLVRRVLAQRTRHLVLAHASEECNRYDMVESLATKCLAELKRQDIVPLAARQSTILPTLWV